MIEIIESRVYFSKHNEIEKIAILYINEAGLMRCRLCENGDGLFNELFTNPVVTIEKIMSVINSGTKIEAIDSLEYFPQQKEVKR